MLLVHAGESRVQKSEESLYVSSLLIPAVAATDSGLYVCLATNAAGGFNYKAAHLTVTSPLAAPAAPSSSSSALPPLVLYVVGGLACLVLVLLTLLVSCLLRSRHHRLQLSDCRSQTTLVYQTHSPASMYNNKSADAATAVHLNPANSITGRSNGGGSVYKGNIYDIPYAHTKYTPISLSDTTASDSPGSVRPPAIDAAGSLIPLSERPVRRLHELQAGGGGGGSGRGSLESATRSGRLSSCANSPRSNPKRIVTINQRNIQYSTQYPDL
jgi:hypothetical protein